MRILALLSGLLAAGVWLYVGLVLGDQLSPFLALWQPDGTEQMAARAIWFGVPVLAVLGGFLALASGYGAALLLATAGAGWFAIGSLGGAGGPGLATLIPMGLSAFGAILAILGRKPPEPEGPPFMRRDRGVPVPDDGDRPARAGGALVFFVALNTVLVLLVAGSVGYFVYRDYVLEARPLPWQTGTAVAVATTPAAPTPSGPAPAGARQQTAVAQPTAIPVAAATTDVFAYCRTVGTVDFPDHRYSGPLVPPVVATAIGAPPSASPDRVRWRCLDGAVMACGSYDRVACAMTPSLNEMLEFCSRRPGTRNLLAPNGTWSCEGTRPTIPPGDNWPVDARGFFPGAWVNVAANRAGAAPG
ncbi:hypothetical protein SAMN02983003_3843 [Devosia enhydra]|uniref:Uncharacterized protein n=1 Tax=Devosia enhydra TaxID=665118 RepID=A0A1K2I4K4_9HYPH|nr:hypothetical protein [Devosia enhydra]SFZ86652.1 hypothetical protein SAMN02983003_3843 [Devosia enhydra]